MQITALIQVINYLKKTSEDPGLLEGYKKLIEVVRDAPGDQKGDLLTTILKEKEQLRNLLIESDPTEMGYASYSLFEKINKNQLFGKAAADYLDNLITTENIEYKTLSSDLNKKVKQIAKMSETLDRFWQLFDQVVPIELLQATEEIDSKSSLFLYFEGRLSVNNISDLERYARLWDGILRSFSRLTGEENLTLDINSFRNGNIVLGVAIEEKTLNALMQGVIGLLPSLSLILKVRRIQIEVMNLPLYSNLNELLEDEILNLINQKSFETAQKLKSGFSNDGFASDDIATDLIRSLKQVLSFVEKGGKIEFKPLISNQEVVKTNKILLESFTAAHELEKIQGSIAEIVEKKELTFSN